MKSDKTIFALGFFDGVHRGHALLLKACRDLADELNCQAGVVTFSNHPESMTRGTSPRLINTNSDREKLMREQFAMEHVVTLPFDRKLMQCPWEDFFRRLLEEYGAAGLVCGEDFRFGYRGLGTSDKLLAACREAGIPCIVVPQLKLEGVTVSSTYIRDLIEMGMAHRAMKYLGHPHVLTGKVVHGHQLGRQLGMPTANLLLPKELVVPKMGVYACCCTLDGKRYEAVTNVGTRPTVAGIGITVEAWILDYQGDLYGRELTLEFYRFLRPEIHFGSLEELKQAIRRDAEETREILKNIL